MSDQLFLSTLDLLNSVKEKTENLLLPEPYSKSPRAFEVVKIFDLQDIAEALEQLLVFKGRVCFVILDHEDYANSREGNILVTTKKIAVTLLLSDRNYGNRQRALVGDATTPGVLTLSKLLVQELIGLSIASSAVGQPGRGELFQVSDARQAFRVCFSQQFEFDGGQERNVLNRGRII